MKTTTVVALVALHALVLSWTFAAERVATERSGAFPFAEITIDDAQARMRAGTLTSVALTRAYLARIAEIDRAGPTLRAVIEVNPDAIVIATALDAERAAGRVRGPLHGVPILIKDNIATADRMETTAGSLALIGARPPRDAGLVGRLREAGVVLLGKTNLTEWANFRGDRSVSGWSARGGQTHNPYALDRNPSGSSSGSAVAVAANLCVVAVGTETDGSVVSPAAHCGIVGVKPTVGLVSRAGIIPISVSQDTAGPMARTVRDAAILLGALAGPDTADAATRQPPAGLSLDFAPQLNLEALRGARIGVMRKAATFHPRSARILDKAIATLREAGAGIIDPIELPNLEKIGAAEREVLWYEFKEGIAAWFASLGPTAPVKSLADLIVFNEAHRAEELAFFGQETLITSLAKGPLTDQVYLDALALARRLSRDEGIDAIMNKHRLDAIITLTADPAWVTDPVNGDSFTAESSTLAAVAGYPSVTVPAGEDFGLPVGLSLIGRAWSEAKLLALAADFEMRSKARRAPEFRATVTP